MPRHDFAERSTQAALSFLGEAFFADETARLPGFLQSLDPRIKIATLLFPILLALFTHSLVVLAFLYLLSLGLAGLSGIRPLSFLRRTWIFIPLFSVVIAIPALFSSVSPGRPLLSAGNVCVTQQGVMAAGFFVARVATSVSWAVLLSMTTPHFALLRALRLFGLSRIFVMVLGMCYRYIYLLVAVIEHTHRAIKSRVGHRTQRRNARRIVAWNIAHLWARSYLLTEQVHGAMVSRGFKGDPVILNPFRIRARDWLWALASVMILAALIVAEQRWRL
jgi:cobalt/nickel transport system permease protein